MYSIENEWAELPFDVEGSDAASPRPHRSADENEIMASWHALARAQCTPRGTKSTEHLAVLRTSDPSPGSLAPRMDHPGKHEYSYDPMTRWNAMAPLFCEAKGAKATEHLALLRLSDPSPGSLAPRMDHPGKHEYSYDPMTRWNAMAPLFREAKGAKATEHLKLLRVNDPSPGSLAPRMDRPGKHEYSYDPVTRWNALSHSEVSPAKGAKTFTHLAHLRRSMPRSESYDSDEWEEVSDIEVDRVVGLDRFQQWGEARKRRASKERMSERSSNNSELSEALTAYDRAERRLERASNETITAFLDADDPAWGWPKSPMAKATSPGAKASKSKPPPAFVLPAAHVEAHDA